MYVYIINNVIFNYIIKLCIYIAICNCCLCLSQYIFSLYFNYLSVYRYVSLHIYVYIFIYNNGIHGYIYKLWWRREEAYKTVLHSDLYQVVYSTISRRIGLAIGKLCDYPDDQSNNKNWKAWNPEPHFFQSQKEPYIFSLDYKYYTWNISILF